VEKTRDGRRRFSREFKIAAVRRVVEGETAGAVARDLGIKYDVLWRWQKRVSEKGEEHLHEMGRRPGPQEQKSREASLERRIAELERLAGRQQMEIGFLENALRQTEELRQDKNDDGAAASSKR
jgi:transposase